MNSDEKKANLSIKKYSGPERRDLLQNGYGRRFGDAVGCPFFDHDKNECREVEKLHQRLNKLDQDKLSAWVFRLFVGSVIGLGVLFITIGWNSLNKWVDSTEKLNQNIQSVERTVVEVKTNQKILMDDLGIRRFHNSEKPND